MTGTAYTLTEKWNDQTFLFLHVKLKASSKNVSFKIKELQLNGCCSQSQMPRNEQKTNLLFHYFLTVFYLSVFVNYFQHIHPIGAMAQVQGGLCAQRAGAY